METEERDYMFDPSRGQSGSRGNSAAYISISELLSYAEMESINRRGRRGYAEVKQYVTPPRALCDLCGKRVVSYRALFPTTRRRCLFILRELFVRISIK